MPCRAAVDAFAGRIWGKIKAVQPADIMVFNQDGAVAADVGLQLLLVTQTAHQDGGAAVDEAPCQAFMQRIGQCVLDGAGALLPMLRIVQPVSAMRDESPSADLRQPV